MMVLGGDPGTAELRADRMKWMRCRRTCDWIKGSPNQAQLNTYFDWCRWMGIDYDKALEQMERL